MENPSTVSSVTISSKGQFVLPAPFREIDRVQAGQQFMFERLAEGEYRIVRKERAPNEGLVDRLLSCSVDDWEVPKVDLGSGEDVGKGLFDDAV